MNLPSKMATYISCGLPGFSSLDRESLRQGENSDLIPGRRRFSHGRYLDFQFSKGLSKIIKQQNSTFKILLWKLFEIFDFFNTLV